MSCNSTKFSITKGVDNTFIFIIKQDNSTLPMNIQGGDTFTADLVPYEDGAASILGKQLTVVDAAAGKVQLTFTEAEVEPLVSEKGARVDRYYIRPTYRLILDCSTSSNGNFIAKVQEVYVD